MIRNPVSKLLRPGDSLKWRSIQGTVAVLMGDAYLHGIRLAGNLIMTRLLFPEAFGLMLIVSLVIMALQMLSDAGIHPAIIVKSKERGPEFINTGWTLLLIRGALLTTAGLLLAKPIAAFYDEPLLVGMISIACLSSVISGFTSPTTIIYDRDVKKVRVVLLDVLCSSIALTITITWLAISPTVWALAAHVVFLECARVVLSHILFTGHKPRFQLDAQSAKDILGFGKWIFLSTALAYLATQGDKLIVSKWITTEELGVFSIAIGLAKVTEMISGSMNMKLVLPIYSELGQNSGVSNREAKAKVALFVICAPFILLLTVGGDLLINLLYDPRYHGAGWMLQIMAIGTMFSSNNDTMGTLIISRGKSFAHMLLQGYRTIALLIAMIIGGHYFGLPGLVYAIALGPALFYPVIAMYSRTLGLRSFGYDAAGFAVMLLIILPCWYYFGWPGPGA